MWVSSCIAAAQWIGTYSHVTAHCRCIYRLSCHLQSLIYSAAAEHRWQTTIAVNLLQMTSPASQIMLYLHHKWTHPGISQQCIYSTLCTHDLRTVLTRNVGQGPTWWRPVKYRWRPLFNAAKFGWRPLLECHAVTLPRRKTHWNLQGCPKLANRSQLLVGRSSPYYQDMWRRYWCLICFFPIVDTCLSSEDIARQSCAMVPKWRFFCVMYFQRATCSTFQTCLLNSH